MDQRKICERGLSLPSWHGRLMVLAEHVLRNPGVVLSMGVMPPNSTPDSLRGFWAVQMLRDNFCGSFSSSVTLWPANKAWHHSLLSSTFVLLSLWPFLPPLPSLPLPLQHHVLGLKQNRGALVYSTLSGKREVCNRLSDYFCKPWNSKLV